MKCFGKFGHERVNKTFFKVIESYFKHQIITVKLKPSLPLNLSLHISPCTHFINEVLCLVATTK